MMMSYFSGVSVAIGAPLANHLWQSTAFAVLAGLLTLALRKNQARVRHWIWLAASVKFLIPFSLLVGVGSHMGWSGAQPLPAPHQSLLERQISEPFLAPESRVISQAPVAPSSTDQSPLLAGVWLVGCAAVLLSWATRWRRISIALKTATPVRKGREAEALRRLERIAGVRPPIELVSSAGSLEPGIFGILRPVLWLPAGIADHLEAAQLDAILAHELCHIRRRDNLTGAIHMVVEALFWFHPLVWWLGARLVEERERACDEEVLRLGSDPEVYAGSILKACQFYLESPVQCVSGVTGSSLQKRIEDIMTQRITSRLDLGKKLLLAAMGIAAVIGPIAVGLLHAPPSHAQSQAPAAAPLTFEVASVKFIGHQNALPPGAFQLTPRRSGGLITWTTERSWLVRYAYHLPAWRILAMETDDLFYAIEAKTDASATEDQIRMMFQTLLADRFKLAVHRETKERTGYSLVAGKNGPKIKEVKPGEEATPLPEYVKGKVLPDGRVFVTAEHGLRAVTGRRVPMAQLAEALSEPLRAVVLDKTGMRGDYYFAFAFVPDDRPVGSEVDGPSLFAAVQEELGLRLEPQKGPVEVLVIDHFEKMPTEN